MACIQSSLSFHCICTPEAGFFQKNQVRFNCTSPSTALSIATRHVSLNIQSPRFLRPNLAAEKYEEKSWALEAVKSGNASGKKQRNSRNRKQHSGGLEQYEVLKRFTITEAAVKLIEAHNTLVFTVDKKASKDRIKDAVEMTYGVQTTKVNTSIRPDGTKKAYVKLKSDFDAMDIAKKIGIF
eukprot:TRINITY_DN5836_c0_g1_i1.p1 TRINITY_DN5836_c0_g1~~TRINITY_DN5836_c0_g1_i1.p1  ORF type:complete len:182 (-),score=36.36 TRINITY_DN5836_c0_g1_i1:236-781(-)